jgi:hypothetical protein
MVILERLQYTFRHRLHELRGRDERPAAPASRDKVRWALQTAEGLQYIHSEVFALGSLLYEMETTYQAFHDKNDGELEELFGAGQFRPTDDLLLGNVIEKCWTVAYSDAGEVVTDIQLIQGRVRDGGALTH